MCYAEPVIGSAIAWLAWRKNKSVKTFWLVLMFAGGGLFGVIDHAWNGELFRVPKNITSDLVLGAVITAVIYVLWVALIAASKTNPVLSRYVCEAK